MAAPIQIAATRARTDRRISASVGGRSSRFMSQKRSPIGSVAAKARAERRCWKQSSVSGINRHNQLMLRQAPLMRNRCRNIWDFYGQTPADGVITIDEQADAERDVNPAKLLSASLRLGKIKPRRCPLRRRGFSCPTARILARRSILSA